MSHRVNDILSGDILVNSGKAEVLNSSVVTKKTNSNDKPDFCLSVKKTFNIEVIELDVLKLLQNLNSSKLPGPDNIHQYSEGMCFRAYI